MEILFLWAGLAFAWIGVLVVRAALADGDAMRVTGEILGYAARVDKDDGSRTYAPVIAFTHPAAGRRIVEGAIATGTLPYAVGQPVTLRVDLRDPTHARLDSRGVLYFGLVFAALGIGLCALFLSIFDWSGFSVAVAIVVSVFILRGVRQRDSTVKLVDAIGAVGKAIGGNAVDEKEFDRARLLSPDEMGTTQRQTARASLVAGIVMVLLGGAAVYGGALWTSRRSEFIERAVPVAGRVVDLEMSDDSESTMYAPVVEFSPRDGWPFRFRHPVASSHPSWRVGDSVRVLYDPADPAQAMIDQGGWNLVMPVLIVAGGVVFVLLGLVALRHALAERRSGAPGFIDLPTSAS